MFGNALLKNIVREREWRRKPLPGNGTINSDATMECRGYIWGIETQLSQSRVEWKSSLEAGSLETAQG
jgi:hypothetical protein